MAPFLLVAFASVMVLALVIATRREIARFALATSLALVAAFLIGLLLAPGEQFQVSVYLGVALVLPTYALLRSRKRRDLECRPAGPAAAAQIKSKARDSAPSPDPSLAQEARWFRRFRAVAPDERFNAAWDKLSREAIGAENRVAVARRGCERFRSELRRSPLDPQAHGLLVLVERRVPELIEVRLRRLAGCGERERRALLEDLLDLLERFAADCERRQEGSSADRHDDEIISAHIEAHLRRDSPI